MHAATLMTPAAPPLTMKPLFARESPSTGRGDGGLGLGGGRSLSSNEAPPFGATTLGDSGSA